MYRRYFGLQEKPFAIAPNPKYLYLGESHREALAHLLYGINGEGCIILLTGEVGTGKTTVCRSLFGQMPETTDIALILNPKLNIDDLLKTICEEFKISIPEDNPSIKIYIDKLNTYLLDTHARGRNSVLIIDEAQNLEMEILEQLRLLTNLETDTHKLLQVVLIGQPELQDILNHPSLRQISQRITTRYHLGSLPPQDIKAYLQHRIAVAGGGRMHLFFTPGAIRYLTKISKGVPRIINLLCDRALLGAYAQNKDIVDLKIMRKAAVEVVAGPNKKQKSYKKLTLTLTLLAFAICLPITWYLAVNYSNIFPLRQIVQSFVGEENTRRTPAPSISTPESLPKSNNSETKPPAEK